MVCWWWWCTDTTHTHLQQEIVVHLSRGICATLYLIVRIMKKKKKTLITNIVFVTYAILIVWKYLEVKVSRKKKHSHIISCIYVLYTTKGIFKMLLSLIFSGGSIVFRRARVCVWKMSEILKYYWALRWGTHARGLPSTFYAAFPIIQFA